MPPRNEKLVSRESVLNFLRQQGFSFKRQAPRVSVWKRGVDRFMLTHSNWVEPDAIRAQLRSAGVPETEVEAFLRSCSA